MSDPSQHSGLDHGCQALSTGLGVTPAEPGYTVARVAPRLGGLKWAKGKVPTPHGLIAIRATMEQVTIDSPVPVVVDLAGQPAQTLPAGRHEVRAGIVSRLRLA